MNILRYIITIDMNVGRIVRNSVDNIFNKHIGAIHNSSPLSAVQRKLMNILSKNAERNIADDVLHVLDVRKVMHSLGWSSKSKTPDNLKECLSDLVSIKIQWNVLGVDKKTKWVTSSLLASVAIEDGKLYYSYSHHLREALSNPNIYAKLNLETQKRFKNKHSMIFWEYIVGELSSKKRQQVTTSWLSYDQVLKLTFLQDSVYSKRYKQFINLVLDKCILEINKFSDLRVSYETQSERGRITHLRFIAENKRQSEEEPRLMPAIEPVDTIIKELLDIGLTDKQAQRVRSEHSDLEIKRALEFFLSSFRKDDGRIQNPVAFFKKALEEGWVLPEVMQHNIRSSKETDVISLRDQIMLLDESTLCQQLRLKLLEMLGNAPYASWLHSCQMTASGSEFGISTPSNFTKEWIESKFHQHIQSALYKVAPTSTFKIIYKLQEELERV